MSVSPAVLKCAILVVDDVEADARLFEAMLLEAGFTDVAIATDARKAADLHDACRFDVVVLDLAMPDMRGLEVLSALHAVDDASPVPVIVVTSNADDLARALD